MDRLYQLVGFIAWCGMSMLLACEARAQCNQRYAWATWGTFSGNKATGSIKVDSKVIGVSMAANYAFSSTSTIANFNTFTKFKGYADIPNATIPKTTWAIGAGGETTMCFSEPVTNPVLLISSLGSGNSRVTLRFSELYTPLYDGGNMIFSNPFSLSGAEGNAIIVFPGIFTCLTIYSETPEFYTNITWGMQIPLSPVTITEKSIDCGGVTLTANGGKSYKWNGGQQPTSAINTVTTSGIYSVTATDQNGCTTIALKDVPAISRPALAQTVSKTICLGEAYAGYTASGVYVDQLKTRYGCDSTRTLNLQVVSPPTVTLSQRNELCSGQTITLHPVVSANVPVTYSWSTGETTPTLLVKQAGTYSLTVADGVCSAITSASVTVNPLPVLLPDESRPCDEAILSAGASATGLMYRWAPSGETTPMIRVTQPGTYSVTVTNSFSCSAMRIIEVTGSCHTVVFGPDSFTPNRDQVNDTFSVFVKNGVQLTLTIFNRLGAVVYSEESATPQWNGRYNGDECPPGTYTYRLVYKSFSSHEVLEHTGTVLLLR